jgi:predicted PurR-regulated permease PerM
VKKFWDEKYAKICLAVVCTVALSYACVLLLGRAGSVLTAIGALIGWAFGVLSPFILGLIIAYLLLPVVSFFAKLLRKIPGLGKKDGLCRALSIVITVVVIGFMIFILLSLIISTFTSNLHFVKLDELESMAESIGKQMVNFYEGIRKMLLRYDVVIPSFEAILSNMKQSINNIKGSDGASLATAFGTGILGLMNTVKNTVVKWGFAIIFSVYFLYDSKKMGEYWDRAFHAILGDKVHGVCKVALADLDKCFAGYIRGQLADAIFMALVVSISFAVAGVPYAALIGIATGIGNLVPYVGPFVAYGMTILSCTMKGEFKLMVIGIIIVFVIQTIDGNIVNPKLLSNSVDVHPVLVIVALLFGSAIGGFLGMLLAVPVAAFLRIQFERFVEYRDRRLREG